MKPFRVVALDTATVDAVRRTKTSPGYRHPIQVEVASGHGPCRHCLRTFRIGEERRILLTYDPFAQVASRPLPGPIYIHEEPCERYPEDAGFPEDLRAHGLTLAAYSAGRTLVEEVCLAPGNVEAEIARTMALPGVAYVHVRDTEAGCYDLRIEPLGGPPVTPQGTDAGATRRRVACSKV